MRSLKRSESMDWYELGGKKVKIELDEFEIEILGREIRIKPKKEKQKEGSR